MAINSAQQTDRSNRRILNEGIFSAKKVCFALSFLIPFVVNIAANIPVQTIASLPTEFASLSLSAWLVGYDWSALVQLTDYYGTGFFVLLTPLMLISNTYLRHQLFLAVVAVLVSLTGLISFYILDRYLSCDNTWVSLFISVLVTTTMSIRNTAAMNEQPMLLALWIILLLIFKNIHVDLGSDDRRGKVAFYLRSAAVAVLTVWTRTVHERSLIFIVILLFCIVLYALIYRKFIVHPVVFIVVFALAWLVANQYIQFLRETVWQVAAGETMRNTADNTQTIFQNLRRIFEPNGVLAYFNALISALFCGNAFSAGLLFLCFFMWLHHIWRGLRDGYRFIVKKEIVSHNKEQSAVFFTCLLFGLCLIATLLAQGFISLQAVREAISLGQPARVYSMLRYYYIYLPPLVMLLGQKLYQSKETVGKWVIWSAGLFLAVGACVLMLVAPTAGNDPSKFMDNYANYAPLTFRQSGDPMQFGHFVWIAALILVLYALYGVACKIKGNYAIPLLVFAMVFQLYQSTYNNMRITYPKSTEYVAKLNGIKALVHNGGVELKELYVPDMPLYNQMVLQYEFPTVKILPEKPENVQEFVMFSNEFLFNREYAPVDEIYYSILDGNEILFVRGEKTCSYVQELGLELTPLESSAEDS